MVTNGRGAWTRTGKDNGSIFYEYISGKPLDGSSPTRDENYLAVNLGVKAIQTEVNMVGYTPPLTADGVFGAKSKAGVTWLQQRFGFSQTGIVNAALAKQMWRLPLAQAASAAGVNPKYLWGQMLQESSADPGAVGFYTPSDRGLSQINIVAHPDVTPQQAHDPRFAFKYSAGRFKDAWTRYAGKPNLQEACSIARHNSPVKADQWYNTGTPPTPTIAAYVQKILSFAATWSASSPPWVD